MLHLLARGIAFGVLDAVVDAFDGDGLAIDEQHAFFYLHTTEPDAGTDDLLFLHFLVAQTQNDGIERRALGTPGRHIAPRAADIDGLFSVLVKNHPAPHAVELPPLRVPQFYLHIIASSAMAVKDTRVNGKGAAAGEGVVVGDKRHVGQTGVALEEQVRLTVEAYGNGRVLEQRSLRPFEGFDGKGVELAVLKIFVEQKLVPVARIVGIAYLLVVDKHAAGMATANIEGDQIVFPYPVSLQLARIDDGTVRLTLLPAACEFLEIRGVAIGEFLDCRVVIIGHNVGVRVRHMLSHRYDR